MQKRQGMLLVLPVPFRVQQQQLLFEWQACNGLEKWADNFGKVTVAAPILPETLVKDRGHTWRDVATLENAERFEFIPLPWTHSLRAFQAHYRSGRELLAKAIDRCQYLQFAISGLLGDWAALAALEANKQGRAYAIHTDLVDYKVIQQINQDKNILKRSKTKIVSFLMQHYHQWIIQHCSLGLWHGEDCYRAYSPFCANSYLIHDVHTKAEDGITPDQLERKLEQVSTDATLRICYAGRMAPMKAPLDWVRAVVHAKQLGADVDAVWLGEGPMRDDMAALITELDAADYIHLVGFEADRYKLLQQMRDSHILLFTHISSESPRCLLEALICGTPIVGYHSLYAEDLLSRHGGGGLGPIHDWQQLGQQLKTLADDRPRLAQMTRQAAVNGSRFNDEAVFRERSRLITTHLTSVEDKSVQVRQLTGVGVGEE